MKASIYNGTKYEISWSLDDTLTDPTLIRNIEDAGMKLTLIGKKMNFTHQSNYYLNIILKLS